MPAPHGKEVKYIDGNCIYATIENKGLVFLGLLSFATCLALLIALIYICVATKDARGRVVKVKPEAGYVIDLVGNDILGNQDCAAPIVSDFGIALTSHTEGRYHICISRDGLSYKRGLIRGRPKDEADNNRPRNYPLIRPHGEHGSSC